MGVHCFVTVDAESELIEAGITVIAELREQVERRKGVRIPITWFIRFQRDFADYLEADIAEFERPVDDAYDGVELARSLLVDLVGRGDEIGWHYHAFNWVVRDDLSHAMRLANLRADLTACWRELRTRHPEFPIRTFRFGWFLVPDYAIYDDLERCGITRDASIDPGCSGTPVPDSSARFLTPLVTAPTRIGGLALFPRSDVVLVHDWSILAHELGWRRLDERDALANRNEFVAELGGYGDRVQRDGGEFLTYEMAERSLFTDTGSPVPGRAAPRS